MSASAYKFVFVQGEAVMLRVSALLLLFILFIKVILFCNIFFCLEPCTRTYFTHKGLNIEEFILHFADFVIFSVAFTRILCSCSADEDMSLFLQSVRVTQVTGYSGVQPPPLAGKVASVYKVSYTSITFSPPLSAIRRQQLTPYDS